MSSFQDNFKRDQEEDMLEYDDSAFYYFSISILSFLLFPATLIMLYRLYVGVVRIESFSGQCKCQRCTALINVKTRESRAAVFNKAFYIKLIIAAFFWFIWIKNFEMVMSIEALQSFDPFAILDVSQDATMKEIKKSYRRLSLEKHPDKNPDNPLAVQEFIRLTKAYTVLTDETAYENFKKYGNPDGPGSYSVAIALPRYLLQPENQLMVLGCAFFVLLVVIPGLIYVNFGDTLYKDEQGVLLENKRLYGAKLNEQLIPKNMPQILSLAIEYQEMGAKDKAELDKLKDMKDNDAITEYLPQTVSRRSKNQNLKPLILILGHLFRDERVNDPAFKESLSKILKSGINHITMMIQTGQEINQMARTGATTKKLGAKAFSTLINFQQWFTQGLWEKNDPLLQLPYFTEEEIKKYRRNLKQHQIPNATIETFCRLKPEQRAQLDLFGGDKAKLAELEKVVKALPIVSLESEVFCDGERNMTANDVITIKVTMKYDFLEEGQVPGWVCSKKYPYLKKHNWYIMIVDAQTKERVMQLEKVIANETNEAKFEMKQRFGQAGQFKFIVQAMNDSYVGLDKELEVSFSVMDEDKDREELKQHQEDIDAVKGPTMVQSMLENQADDSEGDSSDDGVDALKAKLEAAGLKSATEVRKKTEQPSPNKTADNQLLS